MAIYLGDRLLGRSSSLPGSRQRTGPARGRSADQWGRRSGTAPCLTLLPVGFA